MTDGIIILISNAATFHFYHPLKTTIESVSYYLGIPESNIYHCSKLTDIPAELKLLPGKKIILTMWEWVPIETVDLNWASLIINLHQEIIALTELEYSKLILQHYNTDKFLAVTSSLHKENLYSNKFYTCPVFLNIVKVHNSNLIPSVILQRKPFLFDALLGLRKSHRDFVFQQLVKHNLDNRTLISYINKRLHSETFIKQQIGLSSCPVTQFNTLGYYYSKNLSTYDLPDANDQRTEDEIFNSYVANFTDHHGLTVPISRRIPVRIYDNTWYTIVTETCQNTQLFITEKTAKPIMYKRLFVMFGAPGMLAKLHQLGFKTFDLIIDESYDTIFDDVSRFEMAFAQIVKLSTLDPVLVYQQIKHILEHNYRLINSDKFTVELSDRIKKAL